MSAAQGQRVTWARALRGTPTLHRWAHGVTLCGVVGSPAPSVPGRTCGRCARSLSLTAQRVARRERHIEIATAVARMTCAVDVALAGWKRSASA